MSDIALWDESGAIAQSGNIKTHVNYNCSQSFKINYNKN